MGHRVNTIGTNFNIKERNNPGTFNLEHVNTLHPPIGGYGVPDFPKLERLCGRLIRGTVSTAVMGTFIATVATLNYAGLDISNDNDNDGNSANANYPVIKAPAQKVADFVQDTVPFYEVNGDNWQDFSEPINHRNIDQVAQERGWNEEFTNDVRKWDAIHNGQTYLAGTKIASVRNGKVMKSKDLGAQVAGEGFLDKVVNFLAGGGGLLGGSPALAATPHKYIDSQIIDDDYNFENINPGDIRNEFPEGSIEVEERIPNRTNYSVRVKTDMTLADLLNTGRDFHSAVQDELGHIYHAMTTCFMISQGLDRPHVGRAVTTFRNQVREYDKMPAKRDPMGIFYDMDSKGKLGENPYFHGTKEQINAIPIPKNLKDAINSSIDWNADGTGGYINSPKDGDVVQFFTKYFKPGIAEKGSAPAGSAPSGTTGTSKPRINSQYQIHLVSPDSINIDEILHDEYLGNNGLALDIDGDNLVDYGARPAYESSDDPVANGIKMRAFQGRKNELGQHNTLQFHLTESGRMALEDILENQKTHTVYLNVMGTDAGHRGSPAEVKYEIVFVNPDYEEQVTAAPVASSSAAKKTKKVHKPKPVTDRSEVNLGFKMSQLGIGANPDHIDTKTGIATLRMVIPVTSKDTTTADSTTYCYTILSADGSYNFLGDDTETFVDGEKRRNGRIVELNGGIDVVYHKIPWLDVLVGTAYKHWQHTDIASDVKLSHDDLVYRLKPTLRTRSGGIRAGVEYVRSLISNVRTKNADGEKRDNRGRTELTTPFVELEIVNKNNMEIVGTARVTNGTQLNYKGRSEKRKARTVGIDFTKNGFYLGLEAGVQDIDGDRGGVAKVKVGYRPGPLLNIKI